MWSILCIEVYVQRLHWLLAHYPSRLQSMFIPRIPETNRDLLWSAMLGFLLVQEQAIWRYVLVQQIRRHATRLGGPISSWYFLGSGSACFSDSFNSYDIWKASHTLNRPKLAPDVQCIISHLGAFGHMFLRILVWSLYSLRNRYGLLWLFFFGHGLHRACCIWGASCFLKFPLSWTMLTRAIALHYEKYRLTWSPRPLCHCRHRGQDHNRFVIVFLNKKWRHLLRNRLMPVGYLIFKESSLHS